MDFFADLLPSDSQQTISCLDRVSDELHLHVNDISVKMLSIPSQIIATELKNWEAKPPVPSRAFQNLSKFVSIFFLRKKCDDDLPFFFRLEI